MILRSRLPISPVHHFSTSLLPQKSFIRCVSTANAPPLKLAIIGAGPSGFYAASRILSSLPMDANAAVHMYERLPTPYGLVRYGVAPDHPEVKVGPRRTLRTR